MRFKPLSFSTSMVIAKRDVTVGVLSLGYFVQIRMVPQDEVVPDTVDGAVAGPL
jgi:hypothetical protein